MTLTRLFLGAMLLPIALAALLAFERVRTDMEAVTAAQHMADRTALLAPLVQAATALQEERGTSMDFAASGGALFRAGLEDRRMATDQALRGLTAALDAVPAAAADPVAADLAALRAAVSRVSLHRARVDGLTLSPSAAAGYYTVASAAVFDAIDAMAREAGAPAALASAGF